MLFYCVLKKCYTRVNNREYENKCFIDVIFIVRHSPQFFLKTNYNPSGMPQNKLKSKKPKAGGCDSGSGDESEHELFHYANDRIKLMKEVLKLIKPKKIKSIAPDDLKVNFGTTQFCSHNTCGLQHLDIEEINSMLLEELLGISNKRLRYILDGVKADVESSSTDSEEEKQNPVDVISLDDISDEDFEIIEPDAENVKGNFSIDYNKILNFPTEYVTVCCSFSLAESSKKHKKKKHRTKVPKPIKQEKLEKPTKSKKRPNMPEKLDNLMETDKLMSVLEILELQARARAIRSQLALENTSKKDTITNVNIKEEISDDSDDAVIVESPRNAEILITSSESDGDVAPNKKPSDKQSKKKSAKAVTMENKEEVETDSLSSTVNLKKPTSDECDNGGDVCDRKQEKNVSETVSTTSNEETKCDKIGSIGNCGKSSSEKREELVSKIDDGVTDEVVINLEDADIEYMKDK